MDKDDWADYGHEEILQAVIRHVLTADDLDQLCDAAGTPTLIDAGGSPVTITAARTYHDAGVLTLDPGVLLELSDGSQFGLTITVSHRPRAEVNPRPVAAPRPHTGRPSPVSPRPPGRPAAGSCGCDCASGGFCGGCGHAGCARR
jgi:hypothetical protein